MRILVRLATVVGVLFAISIFTFLLTAMLPGDPAQIIAAKQGLAGDPQVVAQISEQYGLDQPLYKQYLDWLGGVLHGDFGETYDATPQPVGPLVSEAVPTTVELLILAQLLSLLVAIPLGIVSAYKENSVTDKVTTGVSFAFLSIPNFALAVFLITIFAVNLGWLPATAGGLPGFFEDPAQNLRQLVLPTVSLAVGVIAVYTRLLRSDMIATLQEDYILMARAKGLTNRRILFRHALRPSSLSLLTVAGINVGALIGGSIIIEILFGITHGMGSLVVNAVLTQNIPVVQACVLLIAAVFVLVNVAVDILYSALDPRIRRA